MLNWVLGIFDDPPAPIAVENLQQAHVPTPLKVTQLEIAGLCSTPLSGCHLILSHRRLPNTAGAVADILQLLVATLKPLLVLLQQPFHTSAGSRTGRPSVRHWN